MTMRTVLFVAVLSLMRLCAVAQTADGVRLSVTYNVAYARTEGAPEASHDVMRLDIGGYSSHFYSLWKVRTQEELDKFNRSGNSDVADLSIATKAFSGAQSYHVYKNLPAPGRLVYTDVLPMSTVKYEEDMPRLAWNLLDGDTIVAGYRCQKAEAELRGRRWTAWYSTDIPVQDGPWKLCGLSGLILIATDSTGTFTFTCTGIERGDGSPIAVAKDDYYECTPQELQSEYLDLYSNFALYLQKATGNNVTDVMLKHVGAKALKKKKPILIETYEGKQ